MYQELKTFSNGQITSESIMKLSIDQLKSLVMLIDGDPANTEEYEHAVFAPEDVRYGTIISSPCSYHHHHHYRRHHHYHHYHHYHHQVYIFNHDI
jgi:hypothetical protein